jgi:F-type H+-transporting ATPase subunit b
MNFRIARFFSVLMALPAAALVAFPETASAAEEGSRWGVWLDVGRVFNLLLVVGVVVFIARKPLANFFSGRTQAIREQLAEAQKARAEAEARLAEIESRMSRLNDELKEIADGAEKDAQAEYQHLIAAAEQDAEKIVERAKQEIEGLTRTAQQELKRHAAKLSVQMAEERIQSEITNADHERLFHRFIAKLGDKS